MNKYIIPISLLFFSYMYIILNFNLSEIYSQKYSTIDDNVIPLLIPPYKMIKEPVNYTAFQTLK